MIVRVIIEEFTQRLMTTAYIWHKMSPRGHLCSMNAAMTSGMQKTPEGRKKINCINTKLNGLKGITFRDSGNITNPFQSLGADVMGGHGVELYY